MLSDFIFRSTAALGGTPFCRIKSTALGSAGKGAAVGAAAGGAPGALVGGAFGLASSLLGGLFGSSNTNKTNEWNYKIMQEQNRFNAEEAKKNRDWQEMMYRMYGTASAKANDMRAAGLNPLLGDVSASGNVGSGAAVPAADPVACTCAGCGGFNQQYGWSNGNADTRYADRRNGPEKTAKLSQTMVDHAAASGGHPADRNRTVEIQQPCSTSAGGQNNTAGYTACHLHAVRVHTDPDGAGVRQRCRLRQRDQCGNDTAVYRHDAADGGIVPDVSTCERPAILAPAQAAIKNPRKVLRERLKKYK